MKRVLAFAPASIGNFMAGFDTLGAAIAPLEGPPLGDQVEIRLDQGASFAMAGPFAHRLPPDPGDNLALKARDAFARAWGRPLPPLAIRLQKNLPVGSGLGSSSATVVATLAALDRLLEAGLGEAALLRAAGEAEGQGCGAAHLDNVAPSLLGGLRLVDPAGRPRLLPFPEDLVLAVLSPGLELNTRDARRVLPAQVPLALAVAHAQNLAALVYALCTGTPVCAGTACATCWRSRTGRRWWRASGRCRRRRWGRGRKAAPCPAPGRRSSRWPAGTGPGPWPRPWPRPGPRPGSRARPGCAGWTGRAPGSWRPSEPGGLRKGWQIPRLKHSRFRPWKRPRSPTRPRR